MKTTLEDFDGEMVDAIATISDQDAHDQLMRRTGEFLNMLDHCARFHPQVITGEYLGDVWQGYLVSPLADDQRVRADKFRVWLAERFNTKSWDRIATELLTATQISPSECTSLPGVS